MRVARVKYEKFEEIFCTVVLLLDILVSKIHFIININAHDIIFTACPCKNYLDAIST